MLASICILLSLLLSSGIYQWYSTAEKSSNLLPKWVILFDLIGTVLFLLLPIFPHLNYLNFNVEDGVSLMHTFLPMQHFNFDYTLEVLFILVFFDLFHSLFDMYSQVVLSNKVYWKQHNPWSDRKNQLLSVNLLW